MTAVTENVVNDFSLTAEQPLKMAHLTVTSDYTYVPTAITGKTVKVVGCYNNTDGAAVKVTQSAGTLTLGNGQSLSNEDCILTWTYVNS